MPIPASSSLSLDGAGGQALDDVLLQEDIDDHHRHENQRHHRAHHAVVGAELAADLVEEAGDGPFLRTAQEKKLSEQIVVRPEEGENGHRGEGRPADRQNHLIKHLEDVAALQKGGLLQIHGQTADIPHKDDHGEGQVARYLGQDNAHGAVGHVDGGQHLKHRNDGGKNRKHQARDDQGIEEPTAPEAVAHHGEGGHARQQHHQHRHHAGDENAVEIGHPHRLGRLGEGLDVVVQGGSEAQGEGVCLDDVLVFKRAYQHPQEREHRGQRPQTQQDIDEDVGGIDALASDFHDGAPF